MHNFLLKYRPIIPLIALYIIIAICLILSGCTTTKYIPVENVVDHYITKVDTFISHDTLTREYNTVVREIDSTAMAQYGITLNSKEKAWLVDRQTLQNKISELQKVHSDTVRDSIVITKVQEVPVEKDLTMTQKFMLKTWGGLVAILVGFVIYIIVKYTFFKFG